MEKACLFCIFAIISGVFLLLYRIFKILKENHFKMPMEIPIARPSPIEHIQIKKIVTLEMEKYSAIDAEAIMKAELFEKLKPYMKFTRTVIRETGEGFMIDSPDFIYTLEIKVSPLPIDYKAIAEAMNILIKNTGFDLSQMMQAKRAYQSMRSKFPKDSIGPDN